MGSFDMNASFSQMPILGKTTVIICLKRNEQLIPITYPVVGEYWDYGYVHDFEENEITKKICEFFEMENMNDVIEFIENMSIHGDYENILNDIKKGEEISDKQKEKFEKYVSILDKLRENSGLKIKTDEELEEYVNKRVKSFSDVEKSKRFRDFIFNMEYERNERYKKLLDSYELALFYENTPVFDALCSEDDYYGGEPVISYKTTADDIFNYGKYIDDKNNIFCITKDCNSEETEKIKEKLARLFMNFSIEGKTFIFKETSILGQESCPYMWYKYGKSIEELWKNYLNSFGNNEL